MKNLVTKKDTFNEVLVGIGILCFIKHLRESVSGRIRSDFSVVYNFNLLTKKRTVPCVKFFSIAPAQKTSGRLFK